jgi:hypothetical protein
MSVQYLKWYSDNRTAIYKSKDNYLWELLTHNFDGFWEDTWMDKFEDICDFCGIHPAYDGDADAFYVELITKEEAFLELI